MTDYSKAIFKINTSSGSGTGFFLKNRDLIITNYHVIAGNKSVSVEDMDQHRYLGNVVYVNYELDLAFVKADFPKGNIPTIHINPDLEVKSTQKIFVHGYPFGMPYTVTEGIISSPSQLMNGRQYIQTDAAVNPGNSGGPMLNKDGELIGVTTSKFTQADNVGFGIPAKEVLKEFEAYQPENPNEFHVRCDSCKALLVEETEFCTSCGNEINPKVFENIQLSHFANFVEKSLTEMGMNPVLARAGKDYWEFHQGSALVRIFVFKRDYLVATSPLNKLPQGNLSDLLSYVLNIDQPHKPYLLGIRDNHIYISYRAHLSDIFSDKADDIVKILSGLPKKADELDNFFVENYQCEMSIEGKKV